MHGTRREITRLFWGKCCAARWTTPLQIPCCSMPVSMWRCARRACRTRSSMRILPVGPHDGAAMKPKQHLEFVSVDLDHGWERPPGYPPGFWQKILAADLDEQTKKGSRTRLLKIDPGAFSTEPFVHDHWEEVYVVRGDLVVGNDRQGKGGEQSFAPTYACRPPGVRHGPFTSRGGCILHEIHYYHAKDRR